MSLNHISRRLEIAFWTGWVQMAVKLRSTWAAPTMLLLGACLLALSLAGASASFLGQSLAAPAPAAQTGPVEAFEHPHPAQENFIFGWVDGQEDGAQLQGLWLVVHNLRDSRLTFLPLSSAIGNAAGGGFYWQPGRPADPAFLQTINNKAILWDHYIIFDQSSMSGLLHLAGVFNVDSRQVDAGQALLELAAGPASTRQALILDELCRKWDSVFENADLDLMGGLLLNNSVTDLSEAHFEQTWVALREAGSPVCDFPTVLGR